MRFASIRLRATPNSLSCPLAPSSLHSPCATPESERRHRVFVFVVDVDAHVPLAVPLDAAREVAPAQRLGPGLGGGEEVASFFKGHVRRLGFALRLRFAPGLSNALGFGLFFDLALEKGAPRLHRLGRGGAVFFDVDDVEQVAGLAG